MGSNAAKKRDEARDGEGTQDGAARPAGAPEGQRGGVSGGTMVKPTGAVVGPGSTPATRPAHGAPPAPPEDEDADQRTPPGGPEGRISPVSPADNPLEQAEGGGPMRRRQP